MSEDRRRADALGGRGFGEAAAEYSAGRPDHPAELVAWLLGDAVDVVDVGAGTGELTRALVGDGRHVVAVEPDGAMLAVLREQVPADRAALLDEVRSLLAGHPDTAGRDRIGLPYRTTAFRAARP